MSSFLHFFLLVLLLVKSVGAFAATATGVASPNPTVMNWSDLGRDTAAAAFVTATWANLENKTDIAVAIVQFRESDLVVFKEIFASLSEAERLAFKTPERMAAMVTSYLRDARSCQENRRPLAARFWPKRRKARTKWS